MNNMVAGVEAYRIPVYFTFTDSEREACTDAFLSLKANPYKERETYLRQVRDLIDSKSLCSRFLEAVRAARELDRAETPFLLVKNAPIDRELPVFDNEDPVKSKHQLKKTFAGEGFLLAYAELAGTPALGYRNVNDGDLVHDIFPKKDLYGSQSQKTLVAIGFHKDLANHFVRPDYVNILSMRSSSRNAIFTTFVRTKDLIESMDETTQAALRRPEFYTPYDDLSVYGDKNRVLGEASRHPVILSDYDFAYFEGRTIAYSEAGKVAVEKLNELLHRVKCRLQMQPGDFVSISNNTSLHGKDVVKIEDEEQQRIRWSIKTVNVLNLEQHSQHYLPDQYGVING